VVLAAIFVYLMEFTRLPLVPQSGIATIGGALS